MTEQEKTIILYVYDPLCGWCYGFSPVMVRLYEQYKDSIEFDVISGGMVVGDRIGPLGEKAAYIREAYKTVEQKMGVKFGDKYVNEILAEGTAIQTSIPASKLLVAFKSLKSSQAILYAHELQNALYRDGVHPDDLRGLLDSTDTFGVSKDDILTIAESEEVIGAMEHDFEMSSQLGVSGFPTVFIIKDNTINVIARGAESYENVNARIAEIVG